MRTISRRSPSLIWRAGNSEGATAWPLSSTTTLRGRSFWATRKDSMVQGVCAGTGWPLAMTVPILRGESSVPIFPDGFEAEALDHGGDFGGRTFVGDVELAGGASDG